jgi:superfamily II DNA or RNA helicase
LHLILETPTTLRIHFSSPEEEEKVRSALEYRDKDVERQIANLKKNWYLSQRYGQEWVNQKLADLKKESVKSLLFSDDSGHFTMAGMKKRLAGLFPGTTFENRVEYPEFKLIPWAKVPKDEMRYYQTAAVARMLESPHSHISVATGGGKSAIILNLIKKTGLRSVVVAPSKSIAMQLYKDFVDHLGKKYVGFYGAGKKQYDKQIVIGIAQSFTRIEPESDDFIAFQDTQVLIYDESQTSPAVTFEKVCNCVFKNAQYRWFTSATQERNDGRDLILEGIIGPEVYRKDIKDLQEEGFLAKLSTLIFDVESQSSKTYDNVVKMNQEHLYRNQHIAQTVANLVNQAVENNMPTLVLVDEHSQEEMLKNYLKVEYAYARAGSDVSGIVKNFNEGKLMCVVGTSAVSTGTNFLPLKLTICWQGNRAGTKVKQGAIGRSTRIHKETGKTEAKIVDFRITNVPMLYRHANDRIKHYQAVGPVSFVKA